MMHLVERVSKTFKEKEERDLLPGPMHHDILTVTILNADPTSGGARSILRAGKREQAA